MDDDDQVYVFDERGDWERVPAYRQAPTRLRQQDQRDGFRNQDGGDGTPATVTWDKDPIQHQAGDRGERQEVEPVIPSGPRLIHQLEIRLVHQRGSLQGPGFAPPGEVTVGNGLELLVHDRQQAIQGRLRAVAKLGQNVGVSRAGCHGCPRPDGRVTLA